MKAREKATGISVAVNSKEQGLGASSTTEALMLCLEDTPVCRATGDAAV